MSETNEVASRMTDVRRLAEAANNLKWICQALAHMIGHQAVGGDEQRRCVANMIAGVDELLLPLLPPEGGPYG